MFAVVDNNGLCAKCRPPKPVSQVRQEERPVVTAYEGTCVQCGKAATLGCNARCEECDRASDVAPTSAQAIVRILAQEGRSAIDFVKKGKIVIRVLDHRPIDPARPGENQPTHEARVAACFIPSEGDFKGVEIPVGAVREIWLAVGEKADSMELKDASIPFTIYVG